MGKKGEKETKIRIIEESTKGYPKIPFLVQEQNKSILRYNI